MKKLMTKTEGNLFRLYWENGGEMPVALSGLYTSEKAALFAGEQYINNRDGVKNGKNNTREK